MIRLNVQIIVQEDKREQLLALLEDLSTNSKSEEGCLAYDIYEHSSLDEKLLIFETWENEDFLALHQKSPHYQAASPLLKKLSLDLRIDKYQY